MKQLLQHLGNGETTVADVPTPSPAWGHVLIRSERSVVSIGTERMLVEFGRAGLLEKARRQPAKVRQVIDKVKADGLAPTIEAVRSKLDQPVPLGYSNAGTVVEIGEGVHEIRVGDRVVSNGPHAEFVSVPQNLCARIPEGVTSDAAAFTVVSSIALQGIRLASPAFGETFAVIGLGLIGLLTTQLLIAHGCRVIGFDTQPDRCRRAEAFGAVAFDVSSGIDPVTTGLSLSNGLGVDGVILTASTKASEPVHQAAAMSRKRGRIVLVGVVGLELSREDFYEKELTFQVSCSYGPGRYDEKYEAGGIDYPYGFVRWTEQRNFQAVVEAMSSGKIDVQSLVTHRIPFERASDAYGASMSDAIGIVLEYPCRDFAESERTVRLNSSSAPTAEPGVSIGVIGAGSFCGQVLLPALQKAGAQFRTIASAKGVSASHLGRKFGFEKSSTLVEAVLDDPEIKTVFIATRHDSHATLAIEALKAGKRVYVEKPLAISQAEFDQLKRTYEGLDAPFVMVGFNRRFSPLATKMRELLAATVSAKSVVVTVNAGAIPRDHWVHDPKVGGGRVLGEACHFVDLVRFLVGQPIQEIRAFSTRDRSDMPIDDEATISLRFKDGSIGTIHYLASGHRSLSKERVEVFCSGRVLQLDNFRSLAAYGWPGFKGMRLGRQDKGHEAEIRSVVEAIRTGRPSPIPWEEIVDVTNATFEADRQIRMRA